MSDRSRSWARGRGAGGSGPDRAVGGGGERSESERGSVLPLVALAVAAAALSGLIVVGLAVRAVHRAEAQTAADLAALAALFEGEAGAAELAERNGAELTGFERVGTRVTVSVVRAGVSASASADLTWDNAGS